MPPLGAHIVVELRERGEHALHQFAGGRIVDWLRRGPERNAEGLQVSAKREVVVFLAGESRQIEDDDELYPALVGSTELQELLKLRAIDRLRALAFLAESCNDFEALALAIFLARLELCRETQILGLLFRTDADVDDRTDHWPQLRSVRRRRAVIGEFIV
jgi:hypothetical protein